MNERCVMNRNGRDDAADIDRAFAVIMSRWGETAQHEQRERPEPDTDEPARPARPESPPESPPESSGSEAEPPAEPETAEAVETVEAAETTEPPDGEPHALLVDDPDQREPRRPRSVEEVFGPGAGTGWRVHTPPEEPDENFVPPRPAPPPGNDVTFWLALGGIVGGPLWLIYLAVAAPYSSRLWFALAIAAALAGFGLMVMRLPARRDPEQEDDDGAVV